MSRQPIGEALRYTVSRSARWTAARAELFTHCGADVTIHNTFQSLWVGYNARYCELRVRNYKHFIEERDITAVEIHPSCWELQGFCAVRGKCSLQLHCFCVRLFGKTQISGCPAAHAGKSVSVYAVVFGFHHDFCIMVVAMIDSVRKWSTATWK